VDNIKRLVYRFLEAVCAMLGTKLDTKYAVFYEFWSIFSHFDCVFLGSFDEKHRNIA